MRSEGTSRNVLLDRWSEPKDSGSESLRYAATIQHRAHL